MVAKNNKMKEDDRRKKRSKVRVLLYNCLYNPAWRTLRWSVCISLVIFLVWLCTPGVTGPHLSTAQLQANFQKYSLPETSEMEEVACRGLNSLERQVDYAIENSQESVAMQKFPEYKQLLNSFHAASSKSHNGNGRCRSNQLAHTIHEEGQSLAAKWIDSKKQGSGATWGQYEGLMHGLADVLSDLEACKTFWKRATFIWQWCNSGDFRVLDQNPNALANLANGIALGGYYGNPAVAQSSLRAHGRVKMERVQHSQHLLMLQLALKANVVNDLDQIVEFGGGTGDMAATLRDNGYPGMYVVYDMEPMTVLQLYWLRYSGHAAFLSKHVQKSPGIKNKAIVLQPAEDTAGFRKILMKDNTHLLRSAFLSFWALNEADVDARDKIKPDILNFGRILLAIFFNKEGRYGWQEVSEAGKVGVDVVSWMKNFVEKDLSKTHNTCMWHFKTWDDDFPAGGYYFVAARKELPPPKCLQSLNCDSTTKHPTIPSTC